MERIGAEEQLQPHRALPLRDGVHAPCTSGHARGAAILQRGTKVDGPHHYPFTLFNALAFHLEPLEEACEDMGKVVSLNVGEERAVKEDKDVCGAHRRVRKAGLLCCRGLNRKN